MMAEEDQVASAVADGGAYEVIRARLGEQATSLKANIDSLNQARIDEFGQATLAVQGRVRVRTEHNCIARDIVPVGNDLLFGYNVYIGLKKETQVKDVFSLYHLSEKDGVFELEQKAIESTFLNNAKFSQDFSELYTYYKEARLIQLKVQGDLLFAVFQIGRKIDDVRVFQWKVNKEGGASYIDNRGERVLKKAPSHDFEWQATNRDMHESGSHPHINIADKVFIETIGGDLTIKVENNTQDGLGIYSEPVDDKTQSLADADVEFAEIGSLVLLKVLPYREKETRYFVYNTRTQDVKRIDAIGHACISLPEDHGIIFPGGYYLKSGESKTFPDQIEGLNFKRTVRSPNGEDVLYVFYEPESGLVGLYSYNLIRKELQNPIYGHGYSLFANGRAVIFNAEEEATRVHPMQIWETPYFSEEYSAKQPTSDSFYSRIGNKELVRGISDLTSICKMIAHSQPNKNLYEDLINASKSMLDSYYWLENEEMNGIDEQIKTITSTAELVIDEFEKVEQIRLQAEASLNNAEQTQISLLANVSTDNWDTPQQYVDCLSKLRKQRGHLITLKEQRYINLERIEQMDVEVQQAFDSVSQATIQFLSSAKAMQPFLEQIQQAETAIESITTVVEIEPINEQLDTLSEGLDLLIEVLNGLKVEDTNVRTQILDDISELYGKVNQVKAKGKQKRSSLGSGEAKAEFAAQFRLFSQSINNALSVSDTPEKADEQQSRLLVQLEELESKFSEFDDYLDDIMRKREELYSAFESRKQSLLEARQRRAQTLFSAAQRIIKGVTRRANSFNDADELNTYFASDPMILKCGELASELRAIDDPIKADDVQSQLKAAKEQAIRSLRDKSDIFEDGGSVIKLGKHKFSVNSQALDLTVIAKDEGIYRHLIGTDYYELIESEQLTQLKAYWQQEWVSENQSVARFEYLSYVILRAAELGENGLSLNALYKAAEEPDTLKKFVRKTMSERYQEGYEKGVHDADAVNLLTQLLPIHASAGVLKFSPQARALAMLFWRFTGLSKQQILNWQSQALSAQILEKTLNSRQGFNTLLVDIHHRIEAFIALFHLPIQPSTVSQSADYLCAELAQTTITFSSSGPARKLIGEFEAKLADLGHQREFEQAMKNLALLVEESQSEGLLQQWNLSLAWLQAVVEQSQHSELKHYIPEAAALMICGSTLSTTPRDLRLHFSLEGIFSEHHSINNGEITLALDEFTDRLHHFVTQHVPSYNAYQALRLQLMQQSKAELQLDSFKAKPLSSFVRNQLIDKVYLPIVGDNLAKQMGTVGEDKRTDLMGLLLLISPPGYGKTTLMEYIADRLGLVFMKINCPSLGHDVTSIDPSHASNATARQELEKLNLGLEMGNNVMLYLDDIQHTHPEFLQKFIALCDGTRRIEGVWRGNSKTYDMRGKKFCVVMAGNPYTESGDMFTIPDMLANRADIYNLGDVLGGKEAVFALSYIENCLTSNPVLAPLALRDMNDLYKLVAMAKGEQVASNALSHQYSGAELNEIIQVLRHLLEIQKVILKVNLQYIESAATAEEYRVEPPFKLQGSYRNMNKMAEKVSAVMNHQELMQLIGDHYVGEAQTLTSGAEENVLKLAQLRGTMTSQEEERWAHICSTYAHKQKREIEGDPTVAAVEKLSQLANTLDVIKDDMLQSDTGDLIKPINRVAAAMHLLSKTWMGDAPKSGGKG
jgi:hypothetical protein